MTTTDRRTVITDAAISTLARQGMRGFTHRAVDRTAGLAEGSTSYYFRTRQALLVAALERMTVLDLADVGDLPTPQSKIDFRALTALLDEVMTAWLTTGRERTLARYELTLEATRRPELRAALVAGGERFRVLAEQLLAAAGVAEARRRGRALVAALDGLVFDQIAGAGANTMTRTEFRTACHELLRAALAK